MSFDTSPTVVNKFNNAAQSKSPVKLTNFKLGTKRHGKPLDIIVKKETRLEKVRDISFPIKPLPSAIEVKIGNLNMFRPGQVLSITAMVTNIQPKKEVTKKTTKQIISLQECQLTDPTGSIKLVMWEDFVQKCENGKTYKFKNIRLKAESGQKSLSTTQIDCHITETTPFPNLQAPEELPSTTTTNKMEIYGVSQITSYSACSTCLKKIQHHPQNPNLVKCQTCKLTFNKKRCVTQYCAKVVFQHDEEKVPLTCFHNSLVKIVEIYNQQNESEVFVKDLTEDQLEDLLCSVDTLTLTYNFTNKQIISIEP